MAKRASLLLGLLGVLAFGVLMTRSDAEAEYLWANAEHTEVFHWASTGGNITIPIIVNHGINPQLVANAAAEWSRITGLNLVVAEIGDGSGCANSSPFTNAVGYIEVCDWQVSGVSTPYQWGHAYCHYNWSLGCSVEHHASHLGASVVFVREPGAIAERYTLCHELGHALGLDHGVIGTRGSCMSSGSSDDWCPNPANIAELSALYSHDDGFTSAAVGWTPLVTGNLICDGNGTPFPTATSTPSPTPTPTATMIPPTPTPCTPPTAKRCR